MSRCSIEKRSRWGCTNCRKRRKKCDESRPSCLICVERSVDCIYPDWSTVKYARTRLRIIQNRQADSEAVSFRPMLLPQPRSNQTRLVHHFQTIVANLISFSSSQPGTTNPFLLYVLPLASSSAQVLRAVEAVAAAHLHLLGVESPYLAMRLHSQSLNLLATQVARPNLDEVSRQNSVAGSILLIYYEIVLGNSASNAWCHLQGAKSLLEHGENTTQTPHMALFLKLFHYFNVMLAMSMGRQPLELSITNEPYFTEQIDPIFGCAGSLWPLMHSLADIISRSQAGQDMRAPARALKVSLKTWSIEPTGTTEAYLETLVQIAQAYKFCGLLSLRMLMPDITSDDVNEVSSNINAYHDLYQAAFGSLLRVGVLSTTMATAVWPLYVVGKLASSTSDRTIILHIFSQCLMMHNMKVVEGARNAVTAHWGAEYSFGINGEKLAAVLIG